MSYFTSFITSLCAACIMIGALHMICPDGAMGKSVKYILSLIFIVSVIAAAAFNIRNFDWNTDYTVPEIQRDESLEASAARLGIAFLDAQGIAEFNAVDGMHLTARGHRQLAEKLAEVIPGLV